MSTNAYIKLVPSSSKQEISIDELKELFQYYKTITSKAGQQADWNFDAVAFPYEIKESTEGKDKWIYLYSNHDRYRAILMGIDNEIITNENGNDTHQMYIQITLPEVSTFGDKGKANEFCKFLAKKLQGELHLFNGRIMYYYKRK